MFRPGTSEIIAGRAIASGFRGAGIGETLRFASARLDRRRRVRRRPHRLRFRDLGRRRADDAGVPPHRLLGGDLPARRHAIASTRSRARSSPTRGCTLEAKRETRFYADQSRALSKFISYLGTTISVIFSIGAIIGAMITMYASVASRTAEIGTLRALGFSRAAILAAFLVESLLLGLAGRRRRARRRVVHAGAVDLDDELPDVRRARVLASR